MKHPSIQETKRITRDFKMYSGKQQYLFHSRKLHLEH